MAYTVAEVEDNPQSAEKAATDNPSQPSAVGHPRYTTNPDSCQSPNSAAGYGAAAPLGLSTAHICTAAKLEIAAEAHRVILTGPPRRTENPGGGRRSVITTFSRQSRKRLLQTFSAIKESAISHGVIFITLTYPREYPHAPDVWHQHLRCFLQALERRFPGIAAIWRMELQERGAPHFHLLVYGVRYIHWRVILGIWASIACENDPNHGQAATDVESVWRWRRLCYYVSKYMAKPTPYGIPASLGRMWGVFNRDALPVELEWTLLTYRAFRALKSALLYLKPPAAISEYQRYTDAGVWHMLPAEQAADLLAWCALCPLSDYFAN